MPCPFFLCKSRILVNCTVQHFKHTLLYIYFNLFFIRIFYHRLINPWNKLCRADFPTLPEPRMVSLYECMMQACQKPSTSHAVTRFLQPALPYATFSHCCWPTAVLPLLLLLPLLLVYMPNSG